MIILISKRTVARSLVCLTLLAGFAVLMWAGNLRIPVQTIAPRREVAPVVVIDPGHGGEDGGAVSKNGAAESQINLAISQRLQQCLRFAGIQTILMRSSDTMLSDEGLATIRQRKVSDIHNRVALVNRTSDALLLSIHQNSLPSSTVTHGAQAFWNAQGAAWAEATQALLNESINDRDKTSRKIPDSVYLMNHVTCPALLVECGFLSNPQEAQLLETQEHQMKLAAVIAAGYLRWQAGEDQI